MATCLLESSGTLRKTALARAAGALNTGLGGPCHWLYQLAAPRPQVPHLESRIYKSVSVVPKQQRPVTVKLVGCSIVISGPCFRNLPLTPPFWVSGTRLIIYFLYSAPPPPILVSFLLKNIYFARNPSNVTNIGRPVSFDKRRQRPNYVLTALVIYSRRS